MFIFVTDPFRNEAFDLEKHLPDELTDLIPSGPGGWNLEPGPPTSQPPPQGIMIGGPQPIQNQQSKFQLQNGEAASQTQQQLLQVS